MAQWVVAVERLLGASPKLLQLLTRALNLSRQEELQIGIPLRIIDILFFRRDTQPTFILPVRPSCSLYQYALPTPRPLLCPPCLLHVHYTLTQSLTGCCWSGSRGGSTLDGGDSF